MRSEAARMRSGAASEGDEAASPRCGSVAVKPPSTSLLWLHFRLQKKLLQPVEALAQLCVLGAQGIDLLLLRAGARFERLRRGERHASFIDRGDGLIGVAQSERRVEILRHRSE